MTFKKIIGVAGLLAVCGSPALADSGIEYPSYSYNSVDVALFPSVEASGSDGNALALEALVKLDEKKHLILGLDYGDFDDDVSNVRASVGLGRNFLLNEGEASMSLFAKLLFQEEEVGEFDDDDTGYALGLEIRHFYQGDITSYDLDGQIEGYWNLSRQKIMDETEFVSSVGGRYHYNEDVAVQLEAQILDDSIRNSTSFPSLSIGVYFRY